MMSARRLLMTSVAVGALAVGGTRPALALLPVFDAASFGQLLTEAQNGARELAQMESEVQNTTHLLSVTQQQLTQLTTFYQSFAHLTSVTQIAPLLAQTSATTPLPELSQIESMLQGGGFAGALAGQAQANLAANQVYAPGSGDFQANQMNAAARSNAATMAAAQALYASASQRQQGLQTLMGGLAASSDPKQSMDIAARATIENGYAQSQANQAAALSVIQKGQDDANQQALEQARRLDDDSFLSAAQSMNTTVPGS